MIYRTSHDKAVALFGRRGAAPQQGPFRYHDRRLDEIPRDSKLGAAFYAEHGAWADELPPGWRPGDAISARKRKAGR